MYDLNKYHFYALIAIFLILIGVFSACRQILKTLRSIHYELSVRNDDKQQKSPAIPYEQTQMDKKVSSMMGEYKRKS